MPSSSILISAKTSPSNYNNNNNNYKRKVSLQRNTIGSLFFHMMRINLKAVLLLLTAVVIVIILFVYMRCSEFSHELGRRLDHHFYAVSGSGDILLQDTNVQSQQSLPLLQPIECHINQEYTVACQRDIQNDEIYVPFSFLRDYFDISGSLTNNGLLENNVAASEASALPKVHFNWMHSNAKINIPKGKYDARGVFMYFENYNVEVRDRVKCISAIEGVPLSTQWEKRGYFYPTQIAQFALSHFSKNLTETPPRITTLEDADGNQSEWHFPYGSNLTRIWHHKFNTSIVQYETAINYDSAITLLINSTKVPELVLSVNMLLVTNSSSLIVTLMNHETNQKYKLHYIPADLVLSVQDKNIYYGLGVLSSLNKWRKLTRDLSIDVLKGLAAAGGANERKQQVTPVPKVRRADLRLVSISFLGVGFFDNLTLSTSAHIAQFYDAAEWFVNHQNPQTGGWVNPVRRNVNGFTELKPGWLSAMGQGHGISVLSRAYWHSGGDKRYLHSANLALKPFRILSHDGGVLSQFMGKFNWYEEYPTTPASFVLNGFIYSLLGLYDLHVTAPPSIAKEAGLLFQQGMSSLKEMLLLYDTGSGSSYDLRHLTLGVAPNLARWDYHATHVNQLLLLATIDNDPLFSRTAERWKGYMFGKRAKHN